MAWYKPAGVWRRRVAISIEIPGGGTTTVDVNVTIPREWDDFWDTIDSSGNELRVVYVDGITVVNYDVDNGSGGAFDKTNRLGRIQIDGITVPNVEAILVLWLYYDSASTQGDGSTAVVIAAARSGFIELARPSGHVLSHMPQTPGLSRPRNTIHKAAAEQTHVWIRYDHAVEQRVMPGNSAAQHEEPLYATVGVENTSGVDQTSMYTQNLGRFVWFRNRLFFRATVLAGTTGTNYTIVSTLRTVAPGASSVQRIIATRIGLRVQDTRHSS